MKTQKIRLWNLADLYRFYQYVRRNNIHGVVRQNQFLTSVRNIFMLTLALPLDAAIMEFAAEEGREIPEFEVRSYTLAE